MSSIPEKILAMDRSSLGAFAFLASRVKDLAQQVKKYEDRKHGMRTKCWKPEQSNASLGDLSLKD